MVGCHEAHLSRNKLSPPKGCRCYILAPPWAPSIMATVLATLITRLVGEQFFEDITKMFMKTFQAYTSWQLRGGTCQLNHDEYITTVEAKEFLDNIAATKLKTQLPCVGNTVLRNGFKLEPRLFRPVQ